MRLEGIAKEVQIASDVCPFHALSFRPELFLILLLLLGSTLEMKT